MAQVSQKMIMKSSMNDSIIIEKYLVYSRLPNKRTKHVYHFLEIFLGGMLLFEEVRLLNLKIFGYKIGI